MQLTETLQHFLAELQRRKVLRVAATYLVGAWVVLQVAVALQTAWALSAAFSGTILNLMIIGFPAAVGLAWFFEITPQGIKRTASSGDGAIAKLQTTDFVLAGALALVFCIGVAQFFWPREAAQEAAAAAEPKMAGADAKKPRVEPPRLGDKSIAVLPFANLSPDKENEYFADGLTEELLNLLAKIGDLRVISRTSSFAFKGKNTPLPEIAKQLGVRHVLEGSVRAAGDELRITAQLIDVQSDTHLWSETYERKIENVFALYDEISRAIAGALKVEVTLNAGHEAPTRNLEAYRLYLDGQNRRARATAPTPDFMGLFKQATVLDPTFAEAHAALGASYATQVQQMPKRTDELMTLARTSAERAVSLKPKLGLAHAVLGLLDRIEHKWEGAVGEGERAVALSPTDSNAKHWLGGTYLALGYYDRAGEAFAELRKTDPLYDQVTTFEIMLEIARGNDASAEAIAKAAIARGTTRRFAHYVLATLSYDRGDAAAAESHYRLYVQPSLSGRPFVAAIARALHDSRAKAAAVSAVLDEAASNPSYDPGPELALLKAYNAIFAIANRPSGIVNAVSIAQAMSNQHVALRRDPRFKAILVRLEFVDYWRKHGWPDRCRAKGEDDFECS